MSSKTILMLLTNAYAPDPRVRQEAVSLIGMGCRVRLLAWDRDLQYPRFESMEGVEVERVFVSSTHGRGASQMIFYAWVYLKMFWRGLRTPFDAIHCHDLDTLPLGFFLGMLRRKPVVYDAHESFPDMLEGSVPRFVQRCLIVLENFFIRRIRLLITVGEKLRRHFEERGAIRSVVVGNWKRLGDFSRSPEQIADVRRALGIPADAFVVGCVTQLLRDRQIEELLAAATASRDVFVVIAGTGILEDKIRNAAKNNPRIIFTGFISGRLIADYTCAADAIYYGFDPTNPNARFSAPNKLYEALAAGRPLITGDFGEIADVVREAECGIVLTEYSDAEVLRAFAVLQDYTTRSRMAANAARAGRNSLNWEKAEETLYREYSAVMPGLRPPSPTEPVALTHASAIGH